jgi:DNA-binding CsgD family transcriptional regulator
MTHIKRFTIITKTLDFLQFMNKKGTRTSIPIDEKIELKRKIADLKSQGQNTNAIAKAVGIDYNTVKKYWEEIIQETGEKTDPAKLLIAHRIFTKKAMEKTLRDFYADKTDIKSVLVAINLANDLNSVNKLINDLTPPAKELPPLLTIQVHNVEVEMPPNSLSDDVE